jgi:hypothetical protein
LQGAHKCQWINLSRVWVYDFFVIDSGLGRNYVPAAQIRWVGKMTYNQKRIVAAMLLLFVAFAGANYYFGFGVFPRYAKLIMLFGVLLTLVYVFRFGPTRDEMEKHKSRKAAEGE